MRRVRRTFSSRARRIAPVCLAAIALLAATIVLLDRGERGPPTARSEASGPVPAGGEARRLSDERTLSRWAYVRRRATAHRRPDERSPRVGAIRTRTPDRTPEVVLVLAERRAADGARWVRARLPVRPNGTTGWVRHDALGRYHRNTTALTIDRDRRWATLRDRGEPVWGAPVAVGTSANPTPRGRFYVRSRIVPNEPEGLYGSFAFGLNGFSPGLSDWPGGGMVGIHGTDRPDLIPGRVSRGCARVRNPAIQRLRDLMSLGTPVRIQ